MGWGSPPTTGSSVQRSLAEMAMTCNQCEQGSVDKRGNKPSVGRHALRGAHWEGRTERGAWWQARALPAI